MEVTTPQPHINAIGTAVPDHDIHQAFIAWARTQITDERAARLFDRMAARSGIAHRWSVLPPTEEGGSPVDPGGFYAQDPHPGTAARMALYARAAPELALAAIANLAERVPLEGISHLVVASCTGFVAPGIDQLVAARLDLAPDVERLLIGYMGCYAAVAALRSARHIVRSQPEARVLVVAVELSTLHLQTVGELEALLAMLQFGDGAAAALVTGDAQGLAIDTPFAAALPDTADLIRWTITDQGFAMHLSGEVPAQIGAGLNDPGFARVVTGGRPSGDIDGWAVHAGGRSILDVVGSTLTLAEDALDGSRDVLRDYGNMSSATLMFVLQRLMTRRIDHGVALAFGPGLAAEGFGFRTAP